MTYTRIKIEVSGDVLKVGNFPDAVLDSEELFAMEKKFLSSLHQPIKTVEFDY